MKRIINGVTFDTDTATEVCDIAGPLHAGWTLYQTRHGAFFEVTSDYDAYPTCNPLADEEAQKLLEQHANHLVEAYFGPFPEHGSAEKRLTVRIPIRLACRVEAAAAARNQNVNNYIMRCLERSVTGDGQPPSVI